jgi:hypothetical protein
MNSKEISVIVGLRWHYDNSPTATLQFSRMDAKVLNISEITPNLFICHWSIVYFSLQ